MHVFGNYWLGELKDRAPQAISAGQHGPRPRFLPHGHQLISASAISVQLHVLILISIQLHVLILISIQPLGPSEWPKNSEKLKIPDPVCVD